MSKTKMQDLIPCLMIENMEKSIEFYQKILEFNVLMSIPEKEPVWALLENHKVQIMLQTKAVFKEFIDLSILSAFMPSCIPLSRPDFHSGNMAEGSSQR